jgi:sugar phosphate isomerase/epimerase
MVRLAAEYEFGAVDTNGKALRGLIEEHGASAANEYLQELGVRIGAIGLSAQWRNDDGKFRDGLAQLVDDAKAAHQAGCQVCTTFILPSTDQEAAPFMAAATRRVRLAAQILDAYGIRLALEFVGPHHLRTKWNNPFIWTVDQTLEWIDAIGCRNVGLLYDSYHWYTNELGVDDIKKLDKSQIGHVHINDAPPVPVAEALDNDRLYPGEGVIDLAGFLQTLKQIGYDGVVAQEVLTPQPLTESTDSLVRKSKAAFDRVFAAAGI